MNDLRIVTALPLSLRPAYEAFLASAGLRDERDADCTALLLSGGGAILACGSLSGRVLKQIAVAPQAEGDGACAQIVTALLRQSAQRGAAHPFLYTKPKNARLFRSLGFFPVAETADMLMMEHRRGGVERYLASLPAYDGESGAVVCHANPFTRGHRHLVEYAAARTYVFSARKPVTFRRQTGWSWCAGARRTCPTWTWSPAETISSPGPPSLRIFYRGTRSRPAATWS